MSRPLLITDCDEVLLHMVRHFGAWLDEAHDVVFAPEGTDWSRAMTHRATGAALPTEAMWAHLRGFFPAEMARQTLVPHAAEALAAIGEGADIVVLTNLTDDCRRARIEQLATFDIRHEVVCNQGGKGPPVRALLDRYRPSVAVFVDDLSLHHASVAEHAPEVFRLHMVAEPTVAASAPPAEHAHARIDDWREAERWIADRFAAGVPAEA